MKKSKPKRRRGQYRGPDRGQLRHSKKLEKDGLLKFYRTMCAALVRRAGGQVIIEKKEFEGMAGVLQWRKTDDGHVAFLFVGPEDPAPEPAVDPGEG